MAARMFSCEGCTYKNAQAARRGVRHPQSHLHIPTSSFALPGLCLSAHQGRTLRQHKSNLPALEHFCWFSDLKRPPDDQPSNRTQEEKGKKGGDAIPSLRRKLVLWLDILKNKIVLSKHKLMLFPRKCFSPPFYHSILLPKQRSEDLHSRFSGENNLYLNFGL